MSIAALLVRFGFIYIGFLAVVGVALFLLGVKGNSGVARRGNVGMLFVCTRHLFLRWVDRQTIAKETAKRGYCV